MTYCMKKLLIIILSLIILSCDVLPLNVYIKAGGKQVYKIFGGKETITEINKCCKIIEIDTLNTGNTSERYYEIYYIYK